MEFVDKDLKQANINMPKDVRNHKHNEERNGTCKKKPNENSRNEKYNIQKKNISVDEIFRRKD